MRSGRDTPAPKSAGPATQTVAAPGRQLSRATGKGLLRKQFHPAGADRPGSDSGGFKDAAAGTAAISAFVSVDRRGQSGPRPNAPLPVEVEDPTPAVVDLPVRAEAVVCAVPAIFGQGLRKVADAVSRCGEPKPHQPVVSEGHHVLERTNRLEYVSSNEDAGGWPHGAR